MPYIKRTDKERFERLVKEMCLTEIKTPGELNYLLTRLTHSFLAQKKESYQNYNDALGALEGCKLEFYRRFVAIYEEHKIVENGDVP